MQRIKSIREASLRELERGTPIGASWHSEYANSPYIYIGGLVQELTEGDIITVFSQYGYVNHINLVRDKVTGKSRGFCFLGYQDPRSTVLAVDNFNGIELAGRKIIIDHRKDYTIPADDDQMNLEDISSDSSSGDRPATREKSKKESKLKEKVLKEKRIIKQMREAMSQDPLIQEEAIERAVKRKKKREEKELEKKSQISNTHNNDNNESNFQDEKNCRLSAVDNNPRPDTTQFKSSPTTKIYTKLSGEDQSIEKSKKSENDSESPGRKHRSRSPNRKHRSRSPNRKHRSRSPDRRYR